MFSTATLKFVVLDQLHTYLHWPAGYRTSVEQICIPSLDLLDMLVQICEDEGRMRPRSLARPHEL
jgi:hypothetical protein